MFLNNDVTSQRMQNLFNEALGLIEQGIQEGNTNIALAYLRFFVASELTLFQPLGLNPTRATLSEQRDWWNDDCEESQSEELNFFQGLEALLELPYVEPDTSTDAQ